MCYLVKVCSILSLRAKSAAQMNTATPPLLPDFQGPCGQIRLRPGYYYVSGSGPGHCHMAGSGLGHYNVAA